MPQDLGTAFSTGWDRTAHWWLDLEFWEQEALKMVGLVVIVLFTISILGDIYRGEIQNRFFKVKLVAYPGANVGGNQELMWVPKDLTNQPIDQIKSNASFFLYFRDEFGRDRRKRLRTFDVRFKVRFARFQSKLAADQEADHRRETLEEAEEAADPAAGPRAEIVALDKSRAWAIARERKEFFTSLEIRTTTSAARAGGAYFH